MSSSQDVEQLRKTSLEMMKCLQLLRSERRKVMQVDELLRTGVADNSDKERVVAEIRALTSEMTKNYETMEEDAKTSLCSPSASLLARLNGFLQDVATSSTVPDAANNFRDAMDWTQYTTLYLNYFSELLKQPFYLNNARARRQKADAFFSFRIPASPSASPHRLVEAGLEGILEKYSNDHRQKMRYLYRYLERSAINSVIEFKLVASSRDYNTVDRMPVCYFKCMMLINNGTIDYSQFIAPHEDWRYTQISPKQIDLNSESRYELYRNVTTQANIVSRHLSSGISDLKAIYQFLSFASRFTSIDEKCLICKNIMKDFSPTTMTFHDQLMKKASYHAQCR